MLRKIASPFILVLVYMLLLMVLSGEGILRATYSIAEQVKSAESSYRRVDDALEAIRLDIYKIAVAARDGLLNRRPQDARAAVVEYGKEIEGQIQSLHEHAPLDHAANIQKIESDVRAYLNAVQLVTSESYTDDPQKRMSGMLGRRQTILDISAALSKWNDADFEGEQKAIEGSLGALRGEIITILSIIFFLGTAAGCTAFSRISRIQKSNETAHGKIAEARESLKGLSRQLVSAQEAERKALSRELHDEIGQSLTALKLELANSEKIARSEGSAVTPHLQVIRDIADDTLRATKNISLGLRPPMLDDLGLGPALNWFTADFSRRTGIAVDLNVDGSLSRLDEQPRTCIYRVVQEALTNCSKHAQAQRITVQLDVNQDLASLTVTDDGKGFDASKRMGTGLGLLSMQERAAELGGDFDLASQPGVGTTIRIAIPLAPVAV